MAAPALVLVPPTPTGSQLFAGGKASPTSSATTSSAPHTPSGIDYIPVLQHSSTDPGHDNRKSAESIFSIYSMYGRPSSWSADGALALSPTQRQSVLHQHHHHQPQNGRVGLPASPRLSKRLESETYQTTVVSPRPTRASGARFSIATTDRSSGPVYALDVDEAGRPASSAYSNSSRSPTPAQNHRTSQLGSSTPQHPPPPPSLSSSATHTRDSSLTSQSTASRSSSRTERRSSQPRVASRLLDPSDPPNVPLPPSLPGTPRPLSSTPMSSTPTPTQPVQNELLTPKRPFPTSSLRAVSPSNRSVVSEPAAGEDTDAFFVRSTYAQLDVSGVKGDGFEEGVERTRARLGSSRASETRALDALGDGSEKTKDLSDQERAVLGSLDRYGFFNTPTHDRLVSLPAAALRQPLAKVTATESAASPQGIAVPRLPAVHTHAKESSRIAKWERMLVPAARDVGGNVEVWNVMPAKEHKLRRRVYKGIPDRWRSAAWEVLMSRMARTDKKKMQQLVVDHRAGLELPSTFDVQIDLDVPRTISGHVMFRTRYGSGQRSLFHVLHSFSLRCSECGYVQGMGPIAATLLCYMDPERVYASLVRLHDAYNMHAIFSPGFPGLLESIYVQEQLTKMFMPGVYDAFKKNMVSTTSYATKWYITLFANSVTFQVQLRLWDAFLLEGQDAFVVIALAIVWVYREQILSTQASFETILSLLSSFFIIEDEDALMSWISRVLGDVKLRENMARWRAEWQGLVRSGKEGDALL